MIYLNQAGTSWPKPPPVHEAVAASLAAAPETWAGEIEAGHAAVAAALGIADPDRLLLTTGATSALAIALADLPWERGDRIVLSGMEHHALHRPAVQLESRGVEVVVVPRASDGPVSLERLAEVLAGGRVRLVAVSSASNVTGERLPLADVLTLSRARGALSLVDAAQTAGWVPIDAARLGADLLAFTGHKGPHAPWGIGGLYVAPHVRMRSPRAICEIPSPGGGAACAPMPGYCDTGTIDRPALAGLVAGLRWLEAPARADRLARACRRAARLAAAAREIDGCRVHGAGPYAPDRRMPTVALSLAGRAPGALAAALAAGGVVASGGLQCAPLAHESLGTAPDGVLRLSIGPGNDDGDVEAAAGALREVAARR